MYPRGTFTSRGTRTGWGRGGFNASGRYVPPQPHIGPFWKKYAKRLAWRLGGRLGGIAGAVGTAVYGLSKVYKKYNFPPPVKKTITFKKHMSYDPPGAPNPKRHKSRMGGDQMEIVEEKGGQVVASGRVAAVGNMNQIVRTKKVYGRKRRNNTLTSWPSTRDTPRSTGGS